MGQSPKWKTDKGEENLRNQTQRGWTILPDTCKGPECGSIALRSLEGGPPVCFICNGSGNGRDGVYSPKNIASIQATWKNNAEKPMCLMSPNTSSREDELGEELEDTKREEVAPVSSEDLDEHCVDQRRVDANTEVYDRIQNGWTLLDSYCTKCIMPLMQKSGNEPECVMCGRIQVKDSNELKLFSSGDSNNISSSVSAQSSHKQVFCEKDISKKQIVPTSSCMLHSKNEGGNDDQIDNSDFGEVDKANNTHMQTLKFSVTENATHLSASIQPTNRSKMIANDRKEKSLPRSPERMDKTTMRNRFRPQVHRESVHFSGVQGIDDDDLAKLNQIAGVLTKYEKLMANNGIISEMDDDLYSQIGEDLQDLDCENGSVQTSGSFETVLKLMEDAKTRLMIKIGQKHASNEQHKNNVKCGVQAQMDMALLLEKMVKAKANEENDSFS